MQDLFRRPAFGSSQAPAFGGTFGKVSKRFVFFCTLPETDIASENGWLEYDRFLLGWPIFGGELLVSARVHFVLDDLNSGRNIINSCRYIFEGHETILNSGQKM